MPEQDDISWPAPQEQPSHGESIVEAALGLPLEERTAFLDKACGSDESLRQLVEALMRAHRHSVREHEPASAGMPAAPATLAAARNVEKEGDWIGRYKLVQEIGTGGCGIVYLAEQEEPIRRRVALKVIKLGMDTKQVIARFEAERQALALMDHPNIAKVLDAGTTGFGRPYFVMELVSGVKITDYCDQHNLSTADRLELFAKVCNAVQHAHQKGIIHRDLKPSNVLVAPHDGAPVPKVIDFGIAKAIEQRLTDKTLFTALEQLIGTPAYMSPEQAEKSGLDIDTRSDIYSLGVLLYELLTGKTPFDAKEMAAAGLEGIRRMIREKDPVRPSARLSTLDAAEQTTTARCRQVEAPKLIHLIRGDLDWIVMKCLEKDRTRRYETANGLAMDVQRHLRDEPVLARPPGSWYRVRKTIRRHKGAFAAAIGIIATLLCGFVISFWQYRDKTLAYERERIQGAKSQQEFRFLKEMLNAVGPEVAKGRDTVLLREILQKTDDRLARELRDEPEVQAELLQILGGVYGQLGLLQPAEDHLRKAIALRSKPAGAKNLDFAVTLSDLAVILMEEGEVEEAEASCREAVRLITLALGDQAGELAEPLETLCLSLNRQRRIDEAVSLELQVLVIRTNSLGSVHPKIAYSLDNLGVLLREQGHLEQAEQAHREALSITRATVGYDHPDTASELRNLANVLRYEGKWPDAEKAQKEALALNLKLLGNEGREVALTLNDLAAIYHSQKKFPEAVDAYKQAVSIFRKIPDRPNVVNSLASMSSALFAQKNLDDAEKAIREAVTVAGETFGTNAPELVFPLKNMAAILERQGKLLEAETVARRAVTICETGPAGDPELLTAWRRLGRILLMRKNYTEAEPLLLRSYAGLQERGTPEVRRANAILKDIAGDLVRLYEEWNKPEKAQEWRKKLPPQ